jgi:hypothetical protein
VADFYRPHWLVLLAFELDQIGRGQHILPRLVIFHAAIAHHDLLRFEIGFAQRLSDFLRIGRPGAVQRIGKGEHALQIARARVVEIAAGLRLVHFVDLVGGGVGLADIPGAAIHHALSDVSNRRNEGRVGKAAVIAEHHRRRVIEIAHGAHIEDGI